PTLLRRRCADDIRTPKRPDDAPGVMMVGGHALAERCEVLAVQAPGRAPADGLRAALEETHLDVAGDLLLRVVHEGAQGLAQGREPEAVVDELRVAHGDGLLEV